MDENLIISENNPELTNLLMGDELYIIHEQKWYANLPHDGNNKHRFLNVFAHQGDTPIPSADRDFFFRMITSIKNEKFSMDADGFAVINAENFPGLTWKNLEQVFSPRYCIFWGVDPIQFGLNCKLNGGIVINQCRILFTDALDQVATDVEKKKRLWQILQRMFDINKSS